MNLKQEVLSFSLGTDALYIDELLIAWSASNIKFWTADYMKLHSNVLLIYIFERLFIGTGGISENKFVEE